MKIGHFLAGLCVLFAIGTLAALLHAQSPGSFDRAEAMVERAWRRLAG